MTVQEVISEIPRFSFEERLVILESIAQSFRESFKERTKKSGTADRLRGLLKPEAELPSDWDWKKVKEEFLAEKYL